MTIFSALSDGSLPATKPPRRRSGGRYWLLWNSLKISLSGGKPGRSPDTRELVVPGVPYLVVYSVEPAAPPVPASQTVGHTPGAARSHAVAASRGKNMMWIELAKEFVELVKAVAWPMAFGIVALSFKPGLLNALPVIFRGKKLEFEGLGFKAKIDAAEQQAAAENPATEKLPQAPALDPSPRPAANIMEAQLRQELNAFEAGIREPILVRALALSRLEAGHEFMYNRIFGSQILALKRLNEAGSATVDDAHQFFKLVEGQFPQFYSTYSFDGWLGFLLRGAMIVQNGNVLQISDFGRDFLVYLTERRLPENKPW